MASQSNPNDATRDVVRIAGLPREEVESAVQFLKQVHDPESEFADHAIIGDLVDVHTTALRVLEWATAQTPHEQSAIVTVHREPVTQGAPSTTRAAARTNANAEKLWQCDRCDHRGYTKNNVVEHQKYHVGTTCSWVNCDFSSTEERVKRHVVSAHMNRQGQNGVFRCGWVDDQGQSCSQHTYDNFTSARREALFHCHNKAIQLGRIPPRMDPIYLGQPNANAGGGNEEDVEMTT